MRLPPLNALKAFEAAARHGSFVGAAEELHVSAGAISRQVKILEDHIGVLLFQRQPQGLSLTSDGNALSPKISASFTAIANATAEIAKSKSEIKVTASPTFANRWLVPRLPKLRDYMSGVTIKLGTIKLDWNEFDHDNYDCAVACFHNPVWPAEIRAEKIKKEELTPLCAPNFLHDHSSFESTTSIDDQKLLHMAACKDDWPNWLELNNINRDIDIDRGSMFETGEMAIRAAVEGLGVVLMDRFLVEGEIKAQKLVEVYPDLNPINNGYFFFCDRNRWDDPMVSSFLKWIKLELDQDSA